MTMFEDRDKKLRALHAQRIYQDPFQQIFGQLNCKGEVDKPLHLRWTVQNPFRPVDLLLFGAKHGFPSGIGGTWLRSFKVGITEQIVEPFPFLHIFKAPNFSVADLLAHLPATTLPPVEYFEGLKLEHRLLRPNEHPSMTLQTASPGQTLQLQIDGPIEHVVILGLGVE